MQICCPDVPIPIWNWVNLKLKMQVQLNLLNKIQNDYVGKEVKRSTVFVILS